MDKKFIILKLIDSASGRRIQRRHLMQGLTAVGISTVGFIVPTANAAISPETALDIEEPKIPDNLKVPPGNVLFLRTFAKGAQIYACPVSNTTIPKPHAMLFKDDKENGNLVAIHYAGPTWEALDGSKVVGQKLVSVPALEPNSVPWVLLQAISHNGSGLFSRVTFIQRVFTKGGIAPVNSCNQTEVLEEYSAQYLFYAAQ